MFAILSLMSVALFVLKVLGYVTCGWFMVFLPYIISHIMRAVGNQGLPESIFGLACLMIGICAAVNVILLRRSDVHDRRIDRDEDSAAGCVIEPTDI